MNQERVKELRESICFHREHWGRIPEGEIADLLSLLDAAQTEPTSAAVDYLLRVVSGYAGTIKNLGQVTLDSTDLPFLESIRSLILSAPSPRVVSREWVRQRATDLDNGCEYCGAESTGNPSEIGIASMLKELGIEVAEVVL